MHRDGGVDEIEAPRTRRVAVAFPAEQARIGGVGRMQNFVAMPAKLGIHGGSVEPQGSGRKRRWR
jgi:hypothetical protein